MNEVLAAFRRIYRFGKKLGIKNNPLEDVERLRSQITPEQIEEEQLGIVDRGSDNPEPDGTQRAILPHELYSAVELQWVLAAARPGVEKLLLSTIGLLGLRHGEALGLRWKMVDLKAATLSVTRTQVNLPKRLGGIHLGRPKSRASYRRLKLVPSLLHQFKEWKLKCPSSDLVFVDEAAQLLGKTFTYRVLKATCERAGVRLLNPHNLRHTFASQCLIAGVAPLKVSHMLGHADVAVTLKIYSHWCCQEESNAEAQLAERIFGAIPKS